MKKGDVRSALNWKVILILLIAFLIMLFLFQIGIITKIVESIKPILTIIPG